MKKITQKTKDSFRQALGNMVKERRDATGISQNKLADMIETTQNRIPELERGDIKNIDTWIAAISALGGQLKIEWKR